MKRRVTERIRKAPEHPGVYLFKDDRGRVLYIGKAKSLRDRLSGYRRTKELEPRIRRMTERAADLELLEAPSELDALLMEARLIRDLQPRYNVRQKDDKSFAVVEVTEDDDFPKVRVVRETDEVCGRRTGPFLAAWEIREAIRALQRVFRFATCTLELREGDPEMRRRRPCLLHAIERCSAPCAGRITKEAYGADVAALERFLKGEREPVVKELEERMKTASKDLAFERAAALRDQIQSLNALSRRSEEFDYLVGDITPIDPVEGLEDLRRVLRLETALRTIEGVDIAQLGGKEAVGSVVTFVDGIPFKAGYRRYKIKTVKGVDDYAMIREVIERRFCRQKERRTTPPDILLVDGGAGHLAAARKALGQAPSPPGMLLSLAKREERVFRWADRPVELPLEETSPGRRLLMYVRDEAHRFAQHYHHLLRRKAIREDA